VAVFVTCSAPSLAPLLLQATPVVLSIEHSIFCRSPNETSLLYNMSQLSLPGILLYVLIYLLASNPTIIAPFDR